MPVESVSAAAHSWSTPISDASGSRRQRPRRRSAPRVRRGCAASRRSRVAASWRARAQPAQRDLARGRDLHRRARHRQDHEGRDERGRATRSRRAPSRRAKTTVKSSAIALAARLAAARPAALSRRRARQRVAQRGARVLGRAVEHVQVRLGGALPRERCALAPRPPRPCARGRSASLHQLAHARPPAPRASSASTPVSPSTIDSGSPPTAQRGARRAARRGLHHGQTPALGR